MTDEEVQADRAKRVAIKQLFIDHGRAIGEWADSRGFSRPMVYAVLNGRSTGRRGMAHRIALALGLKSVSHIEPSKDLKDFFTFLELQASEAQRSSSQPILQENANSARTEPAALGIQSGSSSSGR